MATSLRWRLDQVRGRRQPPTLTPPTKPRALPTQAEAISPRRTTDRGEVSLGPRSEPADLSAGRRGSDGLTWPHPDGLNWPHPGSGATHVSVTHSCSRDPRGHLRVFPDAALTCRIECTSVMSGLGGAPAALPGVDAGRCRRRTGRGSGRCGGTAGPRSGRPGRGGVGPFAWVPADLGYGGREARRSSIWRASPSARVARRPPGEWRRARRRSGLAGKGKELLVPRLHP
jgi:hypothetical protein